MWGVGDLRIACTHEKPERIGQSETREAISLFSASTVLTRKATITRQREWKAAEASAQRLFGSNMEESQSP
jgi:hypothetical protein